VRATALALGVLLSSAGTAEAAGMDEMNQVVSGFYAAYSTFHPSDGIPDAAARAKYEPFISPALDALLRQSDAAEMKFHAAHKDSPPLLEGDLFTSNFEGATSYRLSTCSGGGTSARCAVLLTYDPGGASNPGGKPITWTDAVDLVATPAGWRVDDIAYGGNWDFGNKGKLTETLRAAISVASP
jgi:hypothetical protein